MRLNGTEMLDADGTASLVDACSKGQVGIGRVSVLKLSSD